MRLVSLREPFVTAEILRELNVNLRERMDYTHLHSLIYLFAKELELRYEFRIKGEAVYSKALEDDFKLFRLIGTRILPYSILNNGTIKAIKRVAESFSPLEIITLAKIKAELEGIAPAYLIKKKVMAELWDLFCDVVTGQEALTASPGPN